MSNKSLSKQKPQKSFFHKDGINAVFVDMDGTLLNTLPGLYQVYQKFLRRFGYKGTKKEFNDLNGLIVKEVVALLKERHQLPSSLGDLEELYKTLYYEFYKSHPPLFPHAIECLQYIRSKGYNVVLVTSASRRLVDLVMEHPEVKGVFDDVVTGDLVKHGKPHPEIFHLALKQSGIQSNQAIVIEDAPYGVEAALRAGIYVIRHYPKLLDKVAPRYLENYVDVQNWKVIHRMFELLW